MTERFRNVCKSDRQRFKIHAPTPGQEFPRQHDVLADRIRPTLHGAHGIGFIEGKSPLRYQRSLEHSLQPFNAGNPEKIIPFLQLGPEIMAAVTGKHRSRNRADIRWRRLHAGHDMLDSQIVQQRVCIQRDHQLGLHQS
ncbi:hypothetical protein D3C74_325130 [compost metagenome]